MFLVRSDGPWPFTLYGQVDLSQGSILFHREGFALPMSDVRYRGIMLMQNNKKNLKFYVLTGKLGHLIILKFYWNFPKYITQYVIIINFILYIITVKK